MSEGLTAAIILLIAVLAGATASVTGFGIGSLPVVMFSISNLVLCATVLVLKARTEKAPQPA